MRKVSCPATQVAQPAATPAPRSQPPGQLRRCVGLIPPPRCFVTAAQSLTRKDPEALALVVVVVAAAAAAAAASAAATVSVVVMSAAAAVNRTAFLLLMESAWAVESDAPAATAAAAAVAAFVVAVAVVVAGRNHDVRSNLLPTAAVQGADTAGMAASVTARDWAQVGAAAEAVEAAAEAALAADRTTLGAVLLPLLMMRRGLPRILGLEPAVLLQRLRQVLRSPTRRCSRRCGGAGGRSPPPAAASHRHITSNQLLVLVGAAKAASALSI